MRLNDMGPAAGSKTGKRRVGRGAGSGFGKTCGRGQKGQKSRSGGSIRPGFEGGQLPLAMRVPKFGFRSRVGMTTTEVRLNEICKVDGDIVTVDALKAANVISGNIKRVRIILSGEVDRALTINLSEAAVRVTKGARSAIEAAGGQVED
ncbi:MAG: 50S ribosomal protein L15 [Pseudomonadales bacterium]|jgi:large subunit ribosomal protein L15